MSKSFTKEERNSGKMVQIKRQFDREINRVLKTAYGIDTLTHIEVVPSVRVRS